MEDRFIRHGLAADERPKAYFQYVVTGRGQFPMDMLRFDWAWPATGEDAAAIGERGLRSIKMRSYRQPTVGRWLSFLWSPSPEVP